MLEELKQWVMQGNRSAEIKIDSELKGIPKIWVYDKDLMSGQFVDNPSEINIDEKQKQRELSELARLKAKYEASVSDSHNVPFSDEPEPCEGVLEQELIEE